MRLYFRLPLLVCQPDHAKITKPIFMRFCEGVEYEPRKKSISDYKLISSTAAYLIGHFSKLSLISQGIKVLNIFSQGDCWALAEVSACFSNKFGFNQFFVIIKPR